MASFLRRRRGLIVKLVLLVPVLYLVSLFLYSTDAEGNSNSGSGGGKASGNLRRKDSPPHDVGGGGGDNGRANARRKGDLVPPPYFRVADDVHHKNGGGGGGNHNLDNVAAGNRDEIGVGAGRGRIVNREEDVHLDVVELPIEQQQKQHQQDGGGDELVGIEELEEPSHDINAPGEQGRGVTVDKDKLAPDEKKKYDEGWKNNAYNQYASDMMSLHRSLPDVRDEECKSLKFHRNLPDTSVVVCFHNEAWSVLLRTVHSIIDRSPPSLLKEIILVDDYSDMDHLKQPLTDYVAKLGGKVKVTRTEKREGLIRARLQGFKFATGQVVTFLDSHCECAKGWLEPLLERIYLNETTVVCPVIDVIEDDSMKFQYSAAKSTSIGGFDWNLQFSWHAIPEYERKRRESDISPLRSPTMAGGLFAISRKYFEKLGTYDPGMDIWGGENLELSFRVWMCGGTLEIIPCSHVGHIFRKRSPYSWRTGVNVVKKNSIRLAEVWLDDYKQYYYERFNNDLGEYGDVTERKKLRAGLQCRPFSWFIKNVYPDLFVPGESIAAGEIRSKAKPMCIDSPADHANYQKPVNMWPCHNQGGNQFWMLSKQREIRRDDGCVDYSGGDSAIIYPCHGQKGNQEWEYREDNTLRHSNTGKCAEVSVDGKKLLMKHCTGTDRQIWHWKRKNQKKDLPQLSVR